MKLHELTAYLESIAPPSLQESYDNAGLILGDPETEVQGILVCLDSTEDIITEAIAKQCNVVIAHHPIIFRGLKQITPSDYVGRTVRKAIRHDIQVYAIHTNLDNVLDRGVNGKIASRIGLQETEVLQPREDNPGIGAGVIGTLDRAMDEREFLAHLKQTMQLSHVRHTPFLEKGIRRVAVCGGSGSFLTGTAIEKGAEAFVTGDVKYHEFFDADGKLVLADIGHYESERFTQELLQELISEKFPNFAPLIAETITNPVNYY